MNNNFPFIKDNIKDPVPRNFDSSKIKDMLFKDTNYMREDKLQFALNKQPKQKIDDYYVIANNLINYKVPANSNDLLETIDYSTLKKSFTKEEFDNKYIGEIHDLMLAKNTEKISKDTLDMIQGNMKEDIISPPNLYKPVYNMIDMSTHNIHHIFQSNTFDYKYNGFDNNVSKWKKFQ